MAQPITILVGTMTGTAELVADEVKGVLEGSGRKVEILAMDHLDAGVFARPGLFLVCTSTYGQGDVPDNAQAFLSDLKQRRPDLGHVRYGVIGLGDSTYFDTYCNGGRQFDELLAALGALRIGERLDHNASGPDLPEDAGAAWAADWLGLLDAAEQAAA
ncbi:MAG: flavodoxin domain-containing protein [Alphaproteobacteria bacterium]|nr:flavodoxin domain-containing protein [Alphaproteobacteria bacterium]